MTDDKVIAVPVPTSGLVICSAYVIPDPLNRSPGGLPMDIVELDIAFEGFDFHARARDKFRVECERGMADKVVAALAAIGLKVRA